MVRKLVAVCAATAVLGLAVGCQQTATTPKPADTTKRDDAVKDFQTKLTAQDAKAAEMKAKADKATGDDKAKLDAKVKEAGTKRDAFVKKLDELKAADAGKWEAKKAEVQAAYDEFKKATE